MRVNYKALLAVPAILLMFGAAVLVNGHQQTGEWFLRSIDLKGGTVITLPPQDSDMSFLGVFGARVRTIGGGVLIEVPDGVPYRDVLDVLNNNGISTQDASVQTIGPSLGESFWKQAQLGISMAFVFMGIVVFFLFRKLVPSFAVIFAAIADILVTLAIMQVLAIPLSLAGLAAVLMLIGYSVDTDILLTSRLFKGEGSVTDRLWGALKTGLTMSITTIGVLLVIVVIGVSVVITQIATVLLIGLLLDLVNTWLMNAGVLRWYMERRSL